MDKALAIQKEVQRILGIDEVYLVGGSVRDLVMGNTPKDYDFTTPMLPDEMEEKIKAAGRKPYAIGKKFGTMGFKVPVSVGYENTDEITLVGRESPNYKELFEYEYVEVTTFRSEVYTSKSRKPEVQFVPSLNEDLARRDFTFNAMVLAADGSIYDPYGGRLDIHAGMIKTVGMPKDRIQEDPLRMLRAARFAARYGFKIDPNFIGKARQLNERIFDVSVERWIQEIDKLLVSDNVFAGIRALEEMRIMQLILPEVTFRLWPRGGVENADEGWKALLWGIDDMFSETVKDNNVSLAPKVAKYYIFSGICARLKFSNDRTDIIIGRTK